MPRQILWVLTMSVCVAGCSSSVEHEASANPPTAEEVAAVLVKDPTFLKALNPTSDKKAQSGVDQLRDMARCFTDVRRGKSTRSVSADEVEKCGRVGTGEGKLVVRPHAPAERIAQCWKACQSLRTCIGKCGEGVCFRYAGQKVNCRGNVVQARISKACRECRKEAPEFRESLGVDKGQAPDPAKEEAKP